MMIAGTAAEVKEGMARGKRRLAPRRLAGRSLSHLEQRRVRGACPFFPPLCRYRNPGRVQRGQYGAGVRASAVSSGHPRLLPHG